MIAYIFLCVGTSIAQGNVMVNNNASRVEVKCINLTIENKICIEEHRDNGVTILKYFVSDLFQDSIVLNEVSHDFDSIVIINSDYFLYIFKMNKPRSKISEKYMQMLVSTLDFQLKIPLAFNFKYKMAIDESLFKQKEYYWNYDEIIMDFSLFPTIEIKAKDYKRVKEKGVDEEVKVKTESIILSYDYSEGIYYNTSDTLDGLHRFKAVNNYYNSKLDKFEPIDIEFDKEIVKSIIILDYKLININGIWFYKRGQMSWTPLLGYMNLMKNK